MNAIITKPTPYTHVYGVEWDVTNPDSALTRIGNMRLHRDDELPIHNSMKACLLLDNGSVNYYLNPQDWSQKLSGEASVLTGADGQVMIEIPAHFHRFEVLLNTRRILKSLFYVPGFTFIPRMYVSAYEASEDGGKLRSVSDVLPKTSLNQETFRNYSRARGAGFEMYSYRAHKTITELFYIEYATRFNQLPVVSELTTEGYKQGGLGVGVTTAISAEWSSYNSYMPFVYSGLSNSLASGSGEVSISIQDFGGIGTDRSFTSNRYRGIENPFGHIWKNTDGCLFNVQSSGTSQAYVTDEASEFNSLSKETYRYIGNIPRSNGYITEMINDEILPLANVGGGSTTFYSDYSYTSLPATGESLRMLLVGGSATNGSSAGFVFSYSYYSPSAAIANIGSRLCFLGG